MWNTNFFFPPKFNSGGPPPPNTLVFVQNLKYCTLRYTKLIWGTTRWFTRTALKGLAHSTDSLITHIGPATSVKVTNTASLYNLWIPRFDAFNIWRRLSLLIYEFPLQWDRWFCFVIPQNARGFLLHWRHFDTNRLCNCNIINTWHKILETNLSNGKKKGCIPRTFLVINVCNRERLYAHPVHALQLLSPHVMSQCGDYFSL